MPTRTKRQFAEAVADDIQSGKALASSSNTLLPDFRDRLIRFWLLQYLHASPGRRANEELLREYMLYIGVPLGRDALIDQLCWLGYRNCVKVNTVDTFGTPLMVVLLTATGEDVVMDTVEIDGIARRPL